MSFPPLEIHIQGSSLIERPPERGTLIIAVNSQGTSQETVSNQVIQTSNSLQALFKSLSTPDASQESNGSAKEDPPIIGFAMTNLRTRSWEPQDKDGNKLERRYEASSHFEATFRDFDKLAEIASIVFTTPHTEIRSTTWSLTDETKQATRVLGREKALKDAIAKAEDYARVLGRKVVATEVRDNGTNMKNLPPRSGFAAMVPQKRMGGDSNPTLVLDGLVLEPQDVEVRGRVQVRFVSVD
ncbi:hypothetical protein ACMFMG_006334 [Clarireedia jacksonii]